MAEYFVLVLEFFDDDHEITRMVRIGGREDRIGLGVQLQVDKEEEDSELQSFSQAFELSLRDTDMVCDFLELFSQALVSRGFIPHQLDDSGTQVPVTISEIDLDIAELRTHFMSGKAQPLDSSRSFPGVKSVSISDLESLGEVIQSLTSWFDNYK